MADISEAMVEAAAAKFMASQHGVDLLGYPDGEYRNGIVYSMRLALEAALSAAPASAQMEGMVLVPREPTEAMTRAAIDAIPMDKYMQIGSRLSNVTLSTDECVIIYRAMVTAAPSLRESLPTAGGEKP